MVSVFVVGFLVFTCSLGAVYGTAEASVNDSFPASLIKKQARKLMSNDNTKLLPDPAGIYHAATVCCPGSESVGNFEFMAGNKAIVWTYVFNVWLSEPGTNGPSDPGIRFPSEQVNDISYHTTNCIPFIRMVPRSRRDWRKKPEPLFSVERIARGDFDHELSEWGLAARQFGRRLLVEFGSEMNGDWEPWNATHNGKDALTGEVTINNNRRYLGQKHYRDASIHIIELFRRLGVDNITWFFHANFENNPMDDWNRMEGYYPGDEYIDWIGISCYAASQPGPLTPLKSLLDPAIAEIRSFSPAVRNGTKPLAIAELGAIDYPESSKANWIRDSYELLARGNGTFGPYRDQIKAVSWWDESFWDDSVNPPFLNNNSIASSPEAAAAYRAAVKDPEFIQYV